MSMGPFPMEIVHLPHAQDEGGIVHTLEPVDKYFTGAKHAWYRRSICGKNDGAYHKLILTTKDVTCPECINNLKLHGGA